MAKRMSVLFVCALVLAMALTACDRGGGGSEESNEWRNDEAGFLSVFVPDDVAGPVERFFAKFSEDNPNVVVDITTGPRAELQAALANDDAPDVYIDTQDAIAAVQVADAGQPETFGEDPMQIVVAPENPNEVAGLDVFAEGGPTTGLCVPEVPCGALGRSILAAAAIEPVTDFDAPNGIALVDAVAKGTVDAGLAFRTEVRVRFFRTSAVAVPEEFAVTVVFEMLPVEAGDGYETLTEYLASDAGAAALQAVGLQGAGSFGV